MSDVVIKDFEESQMNELLQLLAKWSPEHPELGQGDIVKWQKCFRFAAMHDDELVGYIAQIPHDYKYGKPSGKEGIEKIGWGVTLVLNMTDTNIRKQSGRLLLERCENNSPLHYAAVGVVPAIEEPYKRRGHLVRRDCSKMYGRFMQASKALKYMNKSTIYAPIMKLANTIYSTPKKVDKTRMEKITEFKPEWDEKWDSILSEQKELYGLRDAEFLNYKLTQPNRDYHVYVHADGGYIIFREGKHQSRDMHLVRICDLVGTEKAKIDLISLAVEYGEKVDAYGVVGLGSYDEEAIYKKAGIPISLPYPITMRPHIKNTMHITFFESDLDNLW